MIGAIGFSGPKSGAGWFQKAIMFFSKSKWSHSFVTFFPVGGMPSVIEAGHAVQTVPFDRYRLNGNLSYEVYQIVGVDEESVSNALRRVFVDYSGGVYGYFQLLWFVWRWLNSFVGRSVEREANWFPSGKICSELVYDYESQVSGIFVEEVARMGLTENTVTPQDLYEIVLNNPNNFKLIEQS